MIKSVLTYCRVVACLLLPTFFNSALALDAPPHDTLTYTLELLLFYPKLKIVNLVLAVMNLVVIITTTMVAVIALIRIIFIHLLTVFILMSLFFLLNVHSFPDIMLNVNV